jgi:hypothetical protein
MTAFFGFAGAASVQAASISHTGPDSDNIISSVDWENCEIINDNDVSIDSFNNQKAISGEAVVTHNTHGGDATSGDTKNTNSVDVNLDIKNNSTDQLRWCDTDGDGVKDAVISKTGPHSFNKISHRSDSHSKFHNKNKLNVHGVNKQHTGSGKAFSGHNNKGGGAHSGKAGNASSLKAHGKVSAGKPSSHGKGGHQGSKRSASIHTTGPNSYNSISHKSVNNTKVYNNNNVSVKSYNNQYASSGSAKVTGNTHGGSATSGSSSNYSSSSVNVSIHN